MAIARSHRSWQLADTNCRTISKTRGEEITPVLLCSQINTWEGWYPTFPTSRLRCIEKRRSIRGSLLSFAPERALLDCALRRTIFRTRSDRRCSDGNNSGGWSVQRQAMVPRLDMQPTIISQFSCLTPLPEYRRFLVVYLVRGSASLSRSSNKINQNDQTNLFLPCTARWALVPLLSEISQYFFVEDPQRCESSLGSKVG